MSEQAAAGLYSTETRHTVEKPQVRVDRQGTWSDAERVERAKRSLIKDAYTDVALWLESCIHCGQCAEACHFYRATGDAKYTPTHKLEPFRKVYRRELSPFRWIHRFRERELTVKDLEDWQELLYDSCTVCGRCSMICPMGIDIATMVNIGRHAMAAAGLVPHELQAATERAAETGSPLGATADVVEDRIEWLEDEEEVAIHWNKDKADVLMTISSIEVMKYPRSLAALAKVLNAAGLDWTFREEGYEATNFGLFSGELNLQKEFSMKLVDAAKQIGAKTVVLPECGHAYPALRWQAANLAGEALPFEVLHITELLDRLIAQGKIKVKPMEGKSVTFHDPCQITRRGGVTEAPRNIIEALGLDLHDMEEHGTVNWCCGGGGGVISMHRPDALRYKVFRLKMEQVESAEADIFATSCSNCRLSFDDGQAHFKWDKKVQSLLDMVAEQLVQD
jgi:Fe-S oxidoreductase